MVDRTVYADEAHTPKIALRQIFGRLSLSTDLCRAAADSGLLSVEVFAMLGDAAAAVKTALRTLIPTAALGANEAAQELSLMQLAAVWHSCHALQGQFATRRARMEEDPNKVPEMAQEDHAEFRSRFVTAHPDVILLDAKEPHKKFVEKISRDFMVHGMVPYYPVSEIRTRSDSILQKTGLTKNAEDLLTISKADEPDQVTDVQTLLNRIHALFMALEYLNICTYSRAAGPLKYLQELEQFKAECSGLPYIIAADSLIRKKVHRLQSEQRATYGTFQVALLEVLNNHKYLWNDARTKAVLAKVDRVPVAPKDEQDRVVESPIKTPAPNGRRRRKKLAKEANKAQSEVKPVRKDQFDKKKNSEGKPDKDKRIPESEWKLISQAASSVSGQKRCHYFNSSMGCALADKCRFKHMCMAQERTNEVPPALTVSPSTFWGSMQIPSGSFFLEIFAGQAGLSQAIKARGIAVLPPIEIEVNNFVRQSVDVLSPQIKAHLKLLLEAKVIFYIHFGTPCSSFSMARKNDGGPPPLRDRHHLWGLPGLRPKDREKVRLGTAFMFFTQEMATLCHQLNLSWSVENPASSLLWFMPPMQELAQLPGAKMVTLDMCRFGSAHKKPTSLLASLDLSALAQLCDMAERPHQHEPLVGTIVLDGKQVFRTRLAQVYPEALCASWPEVVSQRDPLAATFALQTPAADRKRPVGQPVAWKPHKQRSTAEKATAAGYQLKRPRCLRFARSFGYGRSPATVCPWAHLLLPDTDALLQQVADPFLRRLLRGQPDGQPLQLGSCTHIMLWKELLAEAQCVDLALVSDLLHGFDIVGPIQRSKRWSQLPDCEVLLTEDDLRSRAWEFSQKVVNNVMRCEVTENTAKIWDATMEDVEEGVTFGPFFSRQDVSQFLGSDVWIPTQRFEVVQKNKVRGVDSATVNGVNVATTITEKLELPSTDVNVAALRWLRSHVPERAPLQGWVLDERKAYRQIAVKPDQRRWSVIAMREPKEGKLAFFVMLGHSFGLVSAVYNYNRRSAAITDILRRVFYVAAFNFYDDKYGFEPATTCSSAFQVAQKVHWWLGAQFDQKKLQLCSDPTILGVTYDLLTMELKIKPARKVELLDEISAILGSQVLPPGQAGKLRGKLMFGSSQLWGKIGRAFLRALSERQYTKSNHSHLSRAIVLALEQWKRLIEDGPPRPISESRPRWSDYVIFTDGSYPDGKEGSPVKPWIGGVLFLRSSPSIRL
eukprot:s1300_g2.t1